MAKENTLINLGNLRNPKEKIYFRILLVVSVLMWAWIFSPLGIPFISEPNEFTLTSVLTTASILLVLQLLSLFISFWSMAYTRMNGIKVGPEQYPKLYEVSNEISNKLGLKKSPDIFIINNAGLLNAFATKLAMRRVIVLYSDLVDVLTPEKDDKQLRAVLSHELGHHALGHCDFWINYFISAGEIIFTLSTALSRAREYSADSVMKHVIQDEETCSRALIKLAAGNNVGQKANIKAYINQINEEYGFFAWFALIHSSHPFLPQRINSIRG